MGIVVDVLLYLEGRSFVLHFDAHLNVEVHLLCCSLLVVLAAFVELRVVGILHKVAAVMPITVVHAGLHEVLVHIVLHEVLAREVNHRTRITCLVDNEEAGDACILCHLGVVGTKGRSDVHDAGTVFCSDIIARDNTEGFCTLVDDFSVLEGTRLHPREELFVLHANEVSSFASPKNLEFFTFFRLEVSREARLGENVNGLLVSIWIAALDGNIINLRSYAKGSVGGQSPRRRGPSEDINRKTL